MKTLIVNGSPRKNGCTVMLLNELKQHLHGDVTQVDTYYAKSSPCYDCRHCWSNAECRIQDEMQDVYQAMDDADNVIIASPIYFGNLTGSLLNWASRLQLLWAAKYIRKVQPLSEKDRKGAVILVHGKECTIDPAVFAGKDLLIKAQAKCCDVLDVFVQEVDREPVPTKENTDRMVKLAGMMNSRK